MIVPMFEISNYAYCLLLFLLTLMCRSAMWQWQIIIFSIIFLLLREENRVAQFDYAGTDDAGNMMLTISQLIANSQAQV